MQDFDLWNDGRRSVGFRDIVATGTVIVSHAVDPLGELPYYKYLRDLGHRTVLITSKDNPILHMMSDSHELGAETYTDPSRHLITDLRQRWQLRPTVDQLVRLLRFQMLYIDGRLVQHWLQPVEDQWRAFLADRESFKRFQRKFGSFGVKWLRDQDKDNHLLWSSYNQLTAYSRMMTAPSAGIDLFLKFYRLMPNTQLEKMLGH